MRIILQSGRETAIEIGELYYYNSDTNDYNFTVSKDSRISYR